MLESVRITVSSEGGALSGKVGSKYAAQIVGLLASQASPMALFIWNWFNDICMFAKSTSMYPNLHVKSNDF